MLDQIQFSTPMNPDPRRGSPARRTHGRRPTRSSTRGRPRTSTSSTSVNLDGEKTNFYEENQELDWQVRQWVKLQFDKNDFSDLAPLGTSTRST